jgi:hypothetical protein
MSRIRASRRKKPAVLRKRVTIIEEFEPSKPDEVPDKKEPTITSGTALIIYGIGIIWALFKSAVFW